MHQDSTPTTTLDTSTIRYLRRRRAYTGPFTGTSVAKDDALCAIARDILAMDVDNAELALIAKDVDELGYLCVGHIAAILTWAANQPLPDYTFSRKVHRCQRCGRELHSADSIALGFGPECAVLAGVA